MIKVRFAPSPTGFLHIGGARTALFNYMYARAQGGEFILRIEDTDRERSKQEYLDEILDSMHWLGLEWDEIYKQSERFDCYCDHAQQLLKSGAAYEDNGAIIFKMPKQEVKFFDIIRGEVVFDTANFVRRGDDGNSVMDDDGKAVLKDEVLIKSDGSPAYNFCCVVDDALMEISHVVRGEDHLPNTPKQILMYLALGFKVPKFAHLPMILDEQGGKMSKRTGAVAVTEYREKGFLPESLVNYLMLLGWSPGGDLELMTLSTAVKKFSIKKINKSAAAFSMDKLRWMNGQYIKQKKMDELVEFVAPFLVKRGMLAHDYDAKRLGMIVSLYQNRMADIDEFVERTRYLFVDQIEIDPDLDDKRLIVGSEELDKLADCLNGVDHFVHQDIEMAFRKFVDEEGLKMSDVVHPVRIALTASDVGPGLFEIMEALGKQKTVERIKAS